jgi:hypothetical protein
MFAANELAIQDLLEGANMAPRALSIAHFSARSGVLWPSSF